MFVRATRSASVRTRLDAETALARLHALVRLEEPEGMDRFKANGWFLNGRMSGREFDVDYHMPSSKNAQTFAVHGTVLDRSDWRIIRMRIVAHDPWLHPAVFAFSLAYIAFAIAVDEIPLAGGLWIFAFVTALYAVVNLLFAPDVATNRVCDHVAALVHGSVFRHGHWVVPAEAEELRSRIA